VKTWLALFIVTLAATAAPAQGKPPAKPDEARIAALVADLGHDDYQTRKAAHAKLMEIGQPAVPALQAAVQSDDPEIVWRAKMILGKVDVPFVRLEVQSKPRFIGQPLGCKLHYTNPTTQKMCFAIGDSVPQEYLTCTTRLQLLDAAGKPVPHPPDPRRGSTWRYIEAGEQSTGTIDRAELPPVDAGGQYRLQLQYRLSTDPKDEWRTGNEIALSLAMPTPAQAEQVVSDMASMTDESGQQFSGYTTRAKSFAGLRVPVYLPALKNLALKGDADAAAGIGGIATVGATETLIELLKTAEHDKVREGVWWGLSQPVSRYPDSGSDSRSEWLQRVWEDRLTDTLLATGRQLLTRESDVGRRIGMELLGKIGKPGDAARIIQSLDDLLAKVDPQKTTAADFSKLYQPVYAALRATRYLQERGAAVPSEPATDGELLVFTYAMYRNSGLRSAGWEKQVMTALNHENLLVVQFALKYLPSSGLPADQVASRVEKLLTSRFDAVRQYALRAAASYPAPSLKQPVLDAVLSNAIKGSWSSTYERAMKANKIGRDQFLEACLDHLGGNSENSIIYRMFNMVMGSANSTSYGGKMKDDERKQFIDVWKAFIEVNRQALRTDKLFKPGDPALSSALCPSGFSFRFGDKSWPDD
jgi:hypothetical protein